MKRRVVITGLLGLVAACAPRTAISPPPPAPGGVVLSKPARAIPVDYVLVDKSERTMTLFGQGIPLRQYQGLQFGDAPFGHKQFEGDERTPEGRYVIDYRNPDSSYHLSLHISYPDADDRAFAQSHGRSPGGQIFIHGQPNGYPAGARVPGDWTDGCIAMANGEIEELWTLIADGTAIEIRR